MTLFVSTINFREYNSMFELDLELPNYALEIRWEKQSYKIILGTNILSGA